MDGTRFTQVDHPEGRMDQLANTRHTELRDLSPNIGMLYQDLHVIEDRPYQSLANVRHPLGGIVRLDSG